MENNVGYWTVTVIVDSALEVEEDCTTVERVDELVSETGIAAIENRLPTELFILYHGHENDGEECACIQYETSLLPAFTWNMGDES